MNESLGVHEFEPGNIYRHDTAVYACQFADLKGNEEELYLVASPHGSQTHMLLLEDQTGKTISQINTRHRIRGVKVLTDPRSQERWIFLSVNDQEQTRIVGFRYTWEHTLKRETRDFEAVARTDSLINTPDYEWWGLIYPEFIEDIDDDGRLELVCRALDSFTVNPRGLVVYDFASGRIKWSFETSTSLHSVLCDDFDGDGVKEIICSNYALKNTAEIKQGMDDFNGWLMVLSPRGELLHREQAHEDFGQIFLAAEDIDQDGKKEILAVYTTWGTLNIPNSVNIFKWNGGRFVRQKSWAFQGSFEKNNSATTYNGKDSDGKNNFILAAKSSPLIVLDKSLNQIRHKFKDIVTRVWAVEDIDLDGNSEILLQTADNRFVILDRNLIKRAEIDNPFPGAEYTHAHIVRTGFGNKRKIAICSDSEIRYYSYQRKPIYAIMYRFIGQNAALVALAAITAALLMLLLMIHRKNMFRVMINSLQQGIVVLSGKNRISQVNKYLLHLLKDESGQLPIQEIRSLRKVLPEVYQTLLGFSRGKTQEYSTVMTLGRDRTPHIVDFYKLHGVTRRFLITLRTEQATSEVQNDKLLWADMARRLSHNVRRHITNVIMALKPLQDKAEGNGDSKYTDIIRGEIEKIRVFTHAFQRFTELKDYELKMLDVIPSVEHSLEHVSIPASIQLIKNWQLKSVEALIEPIRFEEALTNVLNNALEAMPDGGNLHISVKRFPLHKSTQGDLSVLIEVEDSGRGIPSKYLDEIWQPFFTTKQSGTGIGLPETKKIIESMCGTIDIQSEEGAGTVISIWLKGNINE
ncbi:MAG: hypothetical protein K0B87_03360 [Candidatus Syntrophosphaera sp.]|nr:hypothetical protein [Candidatus Syntrophosphaera sp.]